MTDESGGRSLERWVSLATGIVAPVTVVSALLLYFGYASTRAMYEFFGLDIDAVGLSTQDLVLRSPRHLVVPLIVLLLLGVAAVLGHARVVGAAASGDEPPRARLRRGARVTTAAGALVLVAGVTLTLAYGVSTVRDWYAYDLVVPLCLGGGTLLVAYGRYTERLAAPDRHGPGAQAAPRTQRGLVGVLVAGVLAASLFWATSTLAQWSGRGQAELLAAHLDELPSVILDTRERLHIRNHVVDERGLQVSPEQTFRYRYRNLRLLLVNGGEAMFLVPAQWSTSGTTLVVPMNDQVRVQFQFENPG